MHMHMHMHMHVCIHGSKVHAEAKPLANEAWREGRYEECLGQLNRCAVPRPTSRMHPKPWYPDQASLSPARL